MEFLTKNVLILNWYSNVQFSSEWWAFSTVGGEWSSGSCRTQARPKVTGKMTGIYAINRTWLKKSSIFILLYIFLIFFIYFIYGLKYSVEHEVSVGVVELFIVMNANADWFPGQIWWTISPLLTGRAVYQWVRQCYKPEGSFTQGWDTQPPTEGGEQKCFVIL